MDLRHFQPGTRPYLDLSFPAAPEGRPYVIGNMVGSIDGKATLEGTEQGLGSAEDKRRMQELRAHADAVMNGAGTLRASGATSRIDDPELIAWRRERGKAATDPLGVLITSRADFPLEGDYFNGSGLRAVIYATEIAPARRRQIEALGPRVVDIPEGGAGVRAAAADLAAEEGVRRLLCEGGPSLIAELLHAALLDELFVTLSATLVGGRETLTIVEGELPFTRATAPRPTLLHAIANEETGELYLRYRLAATAR